MEGGGEEEQREDLGSPAVKEGRRGGEREPAGPPAPHPPPASPLPPLSFLSPLLPLLKERRTSALDPVCFSPSPPGHVTGNA